MSTVHELQQQQVLDNLAMFVHNRDSYPYFSVVSQGTSMLTDTGTLAVSNGWGLSSTGAFIFNALGVNPMYSRAHQGAWTINPVNDSIKLQVMRCVYRCAVAGCLGTPPDGCPNCANLFYAYYNMEPPPPWDNSLPYPSGSSNNPMDPSNTVNMTDIKVRAAPAPSDGVQTITGEIASSADNQFQGYTLSVIDDDEGAEARIVVSSKKDSATTTQFVVTPPFSHVLAVAPKPGVNVFDLTQYNRLPIRGTVTPECLQFDKCWFCCGSALPKPYRKCNLVGHYCGTYIWVPPSGVDELTKVTMLIQDIAYFDPPYSGKPLTATNLSASAGAGLPGGGAVLILGAESGGRQPTQYPYSGVLGLNQLLRTGQASH